MIGDGDEASLAQATLTLSEQGHTVLAAGDGLECLRAVHEFRPDLALLDLDLPLMDGWATLARLREFSRVPIVMLTTHTDQHTLLRAIDEGADDFVTKPMDPGVLSARVALLLQHSAAEPHVGNAPDVVLTPGLALDVDRRTITLDGQALDFTRIEFDLLEVLLRPPLRAYSRRQLVDLVWGPNWFGDDRITDTHLSKMRAKLGDIASDPRFIQTVRGFGFRIRDAQGPIPAP